MTQAFTEEHLRAELARYMKLAAGLADSADVSDARKERVRAQGFAIVQQGYNLLRYLEKDMPSEAGRNVILSLVDDLMRAAFELGGEAIVTDDQERWRRKQQAALARESRAKARGTADTAFAKAFDHALASSPVAEREQRGFASRLLGRVNRELAAAGHPAAKIGAVRRRLEKVRS